MFIIIDHLWQKTQLITVYKSNKTKDFYKYRVDLQWQRGKAFE